MSEICVYLKMPSYLRQWFIHRHGGSNPVNLIRGSIESKLLQRATTPQPPGVLPARQQEDEVAICLPIWASGIQKRISLSTSLMNATISMT